jgi:hypothetical protein
MPYEAHKTFEPCDEHAVLWRYLDFTKFVALLETRSLFFASSNLLGDPFEGIFPARNLDRTQVVWPNLPEKEWPAANEWMSRERQKVKEERKYFCVSCWHESAHESDAMWRLYSAQHSGVAIQTTFAQLCRALESHKDDSVHIGRVKYLDYDKQFLPEGNRFGVFLHKRIAFAHEKEVRAIVWVNKQNSADPDARVAAGGVQVAVDLAGLVQRVVVNPAAPAWYHDLVDRVIRRYGLEVPVMHSRLADQTPY